LQDVNYDEKLKEVKEKENV